MEASQQRDQEPGQAEQFADQAKEAAVENVKGAVQESAREQAEEIGSSDQASEAQHSSG